MAVTLPITARLSKAYRELRYRTDDEQKEHKDEIIDHLFSASCLLAELCCRNSFVAAEYTHTHSISGQALRLRNIPVSSIKSIYLDTEMVATTDYKLIDNSWVFYPSGFRYNQLITVNYIAGYDNTGWDTIGLSDYDKWKVPIDIETATICLLREIIVSSSDESGFNRGDIVSMSVGADGSVKYYKGTDFRVRAAINKYRLRING